MLGLKKKAKASDWVAISYHKAKRKRIEDKDTDVYLHGILQPPKKVRKEINRNHNLQLEVFQSGAQYGHTPGSKLPTMS
jgi:hypothetical protein